MNKKFRMFTLMLYLPIVLSLIWPSSVAADEEYIVKPGDTLAQIAQRFGISVEAIVTANNIPDPDLINVNQILDIPTRTANRIPTSIPAVSPIHYIYMGPSLADGYNMGVNTSDGQTHWVTNVGDHICMEYPGNQAWGVVFIAVDSPAITYRRPPMSASFTPSSSARPRRSHDLSQYTHISLELKGTEGTEFLFIGIKDNTDPDDGSEYKEGISNLTTEWQSYTFPLSRFHTADLAQVYIPIEFVFESGTPAQTICFRNIFYTTLLPESPDVVQITAIEPTPTTNHDCKQVVPIFTTDLAPTNGTVQLRTQTSDLTPRDEMPVHKTWNILAGQQIHNDIVTDVPAPRWASLWWQPDGADIWYLLPSQYWHNEGTTADLYGVACRPDSQPTYHTSFNTAVSEQFHPSYRNCPIIPTLNSPAQGAMVNTLAPLFEWSNTHQAYATRFNVQVAIGQSFSNPMGAYSTKYPNVFRDHEWQMNRNLDIATTYYWRAFFVCNESRGPYVTRSFITGSGGIVLPAPNVISPRNDEITALGSVPHLHWDPAENANEVLVFWIPKSIELHWEPVVGADKYLLFWRERGQDYFNVRWIDGNQTYAYLNGLSPDVTYEWSVAARNAYAIGVRSPTVRFTTWRN